MVTEAEVAVSPEEAGAPDPQRRRHPRRRRRVPVPPIVLATLVLATSVLVVPAAWRALRQGEDATGSDLFARYSGVVTGFDRPGQRGERYTFGFAEGPLPDVRMTSARVLLADGSVAAATTVSICRVAPSPGDQVVATSAAVGDLSAWCSEVLPVDGRDLGRLGKEDTLVVTVVPLVDGHVQVSGFHLAYENGGRMATEQIPADIRVGVDPATLGWTLTEPDAGRGEG